MGREGDGKGREVGGGRGTERRGEVGERCMRGRQKGGGREDGNGMY